MNEVMENLEMNDSMAKKIKKDDKKILQEPIDCIFYFMTHHWIHDQVSRVPKNSKNVQNFYRKYSKNTKNNHLNKTQDIIKQMFWEQEKFRWLVFSSPRRKTSGVEKKTMVVVHEWHFKDISKRWRWGTQIMEKKLHWSSQKILHGLSHGWFLWCCFSFSLSLLL